MTPGRHTDRYKWDPPYVYLFKVRKQRLPGPLRPALELLFQQLQRQWVFHPYETGHPATVVFHVDIGGMIPDAI